VFWQAVSSHWPFSLAMTYNGVPSPSSSAGSPCAGEVALTHLHRRNVRPDRQYVNDLVARRQIRHCTRQYLAGERGDFVASGEELAVPGCPDGVVAEQSDEVVDQFVPLGVLDLGHDLLDVFDICGVHGAHSCTSTTVEVNGVTGHTRSVLDVAHATVADALRSRTQRTPTPLGPTPEQPDQPDQRMWSQH
jgi:hypothetical protein